VSGRFEIVPGLPVGGGAPLVVIAGPCVIESEAHALTMSAALAGIAKSAGVPLIYKSSFDKANRSSIRSFRGPGVEEGLRILARVKRETGLPILTDVHDPAQCAAAGEVADVLQIPAFLCRQTDLLLAAATTGRTVNVKKGQFLAPWDTKNIVDKLREAGCTKVLLTERGASFGYNTLVVDYGGLPVMRTFAPVVFDATHSAQLPGAAGATTGGRREAVPILARAAAGAGVDAFFFEVHDRPDEALSDATTQFPLDRFPALLAQILAIDAASRRI
jgi:2-dehydro-3-deoxyphosphooctonate aldolase (KDO 8-P synthase)